MTASTHTGQLIEQPWWPEVELIWLALEESSPSSARYLAITGGESVLLTESTSAFNELAATALQKPLANAENACNYALFFIETTRSMAVPTLLITGVLPPHCPPRIAAFGDAWTVLTPAEKSEFLLRLGRVQDGTVIAQLSTAIRSARNDAAVEEGVEMLYAAGFETEQINRIDYLRRLPVAVLDAAERNLLSQAGRAFWGPDVQRGVQFVGEIPGTTLNGTLMNEAQADVIRDPKNGHIVSAAPNGAYLVSVNLEGWAAIDRSGQLLDDHGFRSMWNGLPRPELGRYGSQNGEPVAFANGDQLSQLNEQGQVIKTQIWDVDSQEWRPSEATQPKIESTPAPVLTEMLQRLVDAESFEPQARQVGNDWVVGALVIIRGEQLIALEIRIDPQGVVDCSETVLV